MTNEEKMQQQIWCISADKLFAKGKWQGLMTENLDYYVDLLSNEGEFRTRGPLETDPSYKQIIGQVVLTAGGRILLHQITEKGSEARLHNMWPILIGGHIETIDQVPGESLLKTAINREFAEEVKYAGDIVDREMLGLVYIENENPVNSVHVGVVYRFAGSSEEFHPDEAEIANMQFVTYEYLLANQDNLTYWSREVLPLLEVFATRSEK
jgi:predicted NUDIX family phosphoesterase